MPKWLKCILPCFKNTKHERTGELKDDALTDFENNNKIDNKIVNDCKYDNICIINNIEKSEIITINDNSRETDEDIDKKSKEIEEDELDDIRKHIACTLHESLNDFNLLKITHTSVRPGSRGNNKENPRNTLVFQTVMLNGEPCTTRYKTTEMVEENFEKESDNKKFAEEIKGSDIKLVFSHEVLEYLTKSFLHNKDNDLNRIEAGANDTVVCTLFPININSLDEIERVDCEMEIDNNISEINPNKNINEMQSNSMDIDEMSNFTDNSSSTMQTENENMFSENQLSPRSEYRLISIPTTNQMINLNSPVSKSSPQMQQENNITGNSKEMTRLRRNISKKVSWKENVEVCFFNHSSKSANEILQEEQPLIDHEVYWKECVGEMDRKRHEIWLKVRADEQRCLTGDGQFHDYFAYRTHHLNEDELAII